MNSSAVPGAHFTIQVLKVPLLLAAPTVLVLQEAAKTSLVKKNISKWDWSSMLYLTEKIV